MRKLLLIKIIAFEGILLVRCKTVMPVDNKPYRYTETSRKLIKQGWKEKFQTLKNKHLR
jgi:hypothetical protein